MQVLLPLKEFAASKQRLAGVLSPSERVRLLQSMVGDVLGVLTRHDAIDRIAICSRDRAAPWLANFYGVDFIDEPPAHEGGLNGAVNAVARDFAARGCADILVVHGDLPLLSAEDVSVFLRAHRSAGARAVTLAPDQRGMGSNLLAWRPLDEFRTEYGSDSFHRHSAQARALNAELTICHLPGARCDIDQPGDLLSMLIANPASAAHHTITFLYESGVAERLQTLRLAPANGETQCEYRESPL